MKRKILFSLILSLSVSCFSQKVLWKADVNSFFDNTEFSYSNVQMPQTMAGTHFAPELGLGFDSIHSIFAGINVLHEFGSDKIIDYFNLTCYYKFENELFRFYMGAFPRKYVLDNYSRMFFQDSIKNYRPNINGIFWEIGNENKYFNVWLDWTSRQTHIRHEAFFMGGSFRYEFRNFYAQFFGYMYHFAGVMDPVIDEPLVDDGLFQTSIGYKLEETKKNPLLDVRVGWALGMERQRSNDIWYKPNGFISETTLEYKGLEIFNTFYRGTGQMQFFEGYRNKLYWGDPFYHLKKYNRTDFIINFIKTDYISTRLTYSLHMGENKTYHEQALYVTFNPDNFSKKKGNKINYIWSNWF